MTPVELFALAALLAGFATGIALIVWGLLDDGGGGGWGGPGDEPAPEPMPGPSGREMAGAGRWIAVTTRRSTGAVSSSSAVPLGPTT